VPTTLIVQLSGLRSGSGVHKSISNLAKANLIAKVKNSKCTLFPEPMTACRIECTKLTAPSTPDDGYRLTYGGLDYLALNAHQKQKGIYSIGNQIGVGKESDIIVVADASGTQRILKIHRLGRISFRTVKANRDYLRHRSSASWMYMSRLAATKEFTFMKALQRHGFSVPEPIAHNRHTIVMSLIEALPLRQVSAVPNPASLYSELIDMILRLAKFGLIHGDFNEFNILIKEETEPGPPSDSATGKEPDGSSAGGEIKLIPILIDFPQMISMDHVNAEMYFDRDVNCIKRYFQRRFGFVSDEPGPFFSEAKNLVGRDNGTRLDVEVEASGFSRKMARELEAYMKEVGVDGDSRGESEDESDLDQEEDEGEKADHTQGDASPENINGENLTGPDRKETTPPELDGTLGVENIRVTHSPRT
jgi:RIO kinase 2